jgi:hypothetical protein
MKLTFGIRKGSEVGRVKTDYLQWLLHYNRDLDPALVREILAELHRRHLALLQKYGLGHLARPWDEAPQWGAQTGRDGAQVGDRPPPAGSRVGTDIGTL